ncbi:MAG: tRNA glutamyl-Q(34) synthetase GluQRS [Gammaproteobacteria bacterium]|nr:tRNA glutamyl-Q(34) synthetase GluQRS [Gammaproteobacteria bacterium]MDP2140242.1 tRNA glutamyl-Q(34) synthetase GluQRS [Gammaproteobacteria bacterium]MDP2348117.1 tRNA glutamyl-Q(34) synthetase GluQRS [Gammaproteobacteria bacterium]
MTLKADYIGRFAPSPSGPLHFGSLVAALASYLDARSRGGQWLLRMEDLDPARESPEAADDIRATLDRFSLYWDGSVLYQSERLDAYANVLQSLRDRDLVYACDCSRTQINEIGGVYDNRCRYRSETTQPNALRVKVADEIIRFEDTIQGPQQQELLRECGDFVLLRKDGLFAYQLAVVVDDAFQNITDIVRGYDLLDSTPRQIYLQRLLGFPPPHYAHIPVAVNELGQKLSKQHFAAPINPESPGKQILAALRFLGMQPPADLGNAPPGTLLPWAIEHWDIQAVPKLANIPLEQFS